MSYDIELQDPVTGECIILDANHQMRGGTYAVGGTAKARLNVTYNYYEILCRCLDNDKGIRALYGIQAVDSIPMLEAAIAKLSDDVNSDYWKATEGNVKRALYQLLALAKMRPDGVWDGD